MDNKNACIYRSLDTISNANRVDEFHQKQWNGIDNGVSRAMSSLLIDSSSNKIDISRQASSFVVIPNVDGKIKNQNKNQQVKCIPKELPIPVQYLQSYFVLSDPSKLDEVMSGLCDRFNGVYKPEKGNFKAELENGTEMKVNSYKEKASGCIIIEFVRLDGCAFTFHRALIESKLYLLPYLQVSNMENAKLQIQEELKVIQNKLKMWYEEPQIKLAPYVQ